MCEVFKGKKFFILYDGFFYVNGNIYLGYVVNKILKDIIMKLKIVLGFDMFYVLGWDCYGLLIELKVEGLVGKLNEKILVVEFC